MLLTGIGMMGYKLVVTCGFVDYANWGTATTCTYCNGESVTLSAFGHAIAHQFIVL